MSMIGLGAEGRKTVITGVEMFRKILDRGEAGDNVGLFVTCLPFQYLSEQLFFAYETKNLASHY